LSSEIVNEAEFAFMTVLACGTENIAVFHTHSFMDVRKDTLHWCCCWYPANWVFISLYNKYPDVWGDFLVCQAFACTTWSHKTRARPEIGILCNGI